MYINLGAYDDTLDARHVPTAGRSAIRKPPPFKIPSPAHQRTTVRNLKTLGTKKHSTLGGIDLPLGAFRTRIFTMTKPAVPAYVVNRYKPTLYGMRNLKALGEYDDGNLGKFKIKNVVKSVTKAVTQVAKVAVAPIALTAATSLNAVGLRNAASKVISSTALTPSIAKAENTAAKAAGWAVDAGALVVGGIAAAPAISSAASAVGGAVSSAASTVGALTSKLGGGLLSKVIGVGESLLGKKPKQPGDTSAPSDTSGSYSGLGPIVQQVEGALSPAVTAGSTPAARTRGQRGASSGTPDQTAVQAASVAPSIFQPSDGGAAAPAPVTADASAPNPLMASLMGAASNPAVLLAAAGASALFFIAGRKKTASRRKR